MKMMAVGVISWNTRDLLRECLESVVAQAPAEVVVIDNGSNDDSPGMVRRMFPSVQVTVNPENPGFGAAANQAFASTTAPYLLLLNGDTRLCPDALSALGEYLARQPSVGVVGPRLRRPDGRLQSSCSAFPNPLVPVVKSKGLTRLIGRIPVLRDHVLDTWSHDRPRKVPWVVGAALAIRREAFESVGGFDESFHMYFEEPDLCFRMLKAGWETHFAPVADIIHVEGASTQQRRHDMLWEWAVSYARYNERHCSGRRLAVARLMFKAGMLVRWCRENVRSVFARDSRSRAQIAGDAAVWSRALGLGSGGELGTRRRRPPE
jgi:GT2 family glycosyltransferase